MPRGRPKGSKNRPKDLIPQEPKVKGPRGRPKGSKNKALGAVIPKVEEPKAEEPTLQAEEPEEPGPIIPSTIPFKRSAIPIHIHSGKLLSFGSYRIPATIPSTLLQTLQHNPKTMLLHPYLLDLSQVPFGQQVTYQRRQHELEPCFNALRDKGVTLVPSYSVLSWEVQIEV